MEAREREEKRVRGGGVGERKVGGREGWRVGERKERGEGGGGWEKEGFHEQCSELRLW